MKLLHRLGFNAAGQASCLEDISRLLGAGMPLRQMCGFLANSGRNAQVRALAQGSLDGIRQWMACNGAASRHTHAAGRIATGEMDLLAVEQRIDPYNPEEPCQ